MKSKDDKTFITGMGVREKEAKKLGVSYEIVPKAKEIEETFQELNNLSFMTTTPKFVSLRIGIFLYTIEIIIKKISLQCFKIIYSYYCVFAGFI